MVKNLPARAGDARDVCSISGSGRSPGGGNGNPLQYPCLLKSHGQRNLVGYSPWGCREPDTTEPSTAGREWNLLAHALFSSWKQRGPEVGHLHPGLYPKPVFLFDT